MQTLKNFLFPPSKLPNSFPWTVQTAGKKYFVGLWHFAVGSFLVPILFMGAILALARFPELRMAFLTPETTLRVLIGAALTGFSAAAIANALRLSLSAGGTGLIPGVLRGTPYYLVAGAAFACALPWTIHAIDPIFPELISGVAEMVTGPDGKPNITFMMWLSLISFVMGFGMQLRYIAAEMRKDGLTLAEAMSLTLKPLKGSWWGATLFNLVLPVAIAYGLAQLIGEGVVAILGPGHQPTVELAKQATGGNFVLFAIMAVIGAPLFEELIFRGFLYQVIRCSLLRDMQPLALANVPEKGLRRYLAIASNFVKQLTHSAAARFHKVFGGKHAELSAIIISSLMFSLMHMQFNPTTMIMLFVLGCIQAEIYRRTGSLYAGMLLHAVNNGIDVLKLALGHA